MSDLGHLGREIATFLKHRHAAALVGLMIEVCFSGCGPDMNIINAAITKVQADALRAQLAAKKAEGFAEQARLVANKVQSAAERADESERRANDAVSRITPTWPAVIVH